MTIATRITQDLGIDAPICSAGIVRSMVDEAAEVFAAFAQRAESV